MKFIKLIVASLVLINLYKCNITGDCGNQVFKEIPNDSKTYKVIKFYRGCGATSSNSIQLSLIKYTDTLPNDKGNTFISDSKVGMYIDRDTSVLINWKNDNTILIRYDRDLPTYFKNGLIGNIKILYEVK